MLLTRSSEPETSIPEGLRRIAGSLPLHSSDHVVVKPNLGNPFHVDGVTTHREVLIPIIAWLRDRYSDVAVVESNGIRYSCNAAFESMGLRNLIPKLGARLVNLSEDEVLREALVSYGSLRVSLPRTLAEADLVVSVPVIKSHELTTVSLAVKNLFGCVPTPTRIRLHPVLDHVLAGLCVRLRPKVVVGDGLTVMEGNGPIHGETRRMDLLTFSNSALAHDAIVSKVLFGVDWTSIGHLALAQDRLGEDIDLLGLVNEYGPLPTLKIPSLDLVARTMARTYKYQRLTEVLYLSPLFHLLNKIAWGYRAVFGRKPKFQLHY